MATDKTAGLDKELSEIDKRIVALGERVEKLEALGERVEKLEARGAGSFDPGTKELVLELYERVFGSRPE